MAQQIEKGLALSVAGQVAVGLAAGDNELLRARMALTAIGLFISNACEDEDVRQTLNLANHIIITDGT